MKTGDKKPRIGCTWSVHCMYTGSVKRSLIALGLLLLLVTAGCRASLPGMTQSSSGQTFKVYKMRGKVVAVDAGKGAITVDHEAIPGFMDAMAMPYKLKDPQKSRELHAGDRITADVLVSQEDENNVLLDHLVVVAEARPQSSAGKH